jgi:predicted nuclease with TOPRIM domain
MNETDSVIIAWAWIFAGVALISAGLRVAQWLLQRHLQRLVERRIALDAKLDAQMAELQRLVAQAAWIEASAKADKERLANARYFQAAMRDDL